MTQTQYRKHIENEIKKLNVKIDKKIVNGTDYSTEAKEHRALLNLLNNIK